MNRDGSICANPYLRTNATPWPSAAAIEGKRSAGRLSDLLAEVAKPVGATPEQALFLAQTVVSRVTTDDTSLMVDLRSCLPDEFSTLFTEPDPLPERSSRATDAPRPLNDEEVATALRQRPGWTGDTHELSRTVALPADRVQLLLTHVEQAAA